MCDCGNDCEKYAALKEEMFSYFITEMENWADKHGLDSIDTLEVLKALHNSLAKQLATETVLQKIMGKMYTTKDVPLNTEGMDEAFGNLFINNRDNKEN